MTPRGAIALLALLLTLVAPSGRAAHATAQAAPASPGSSTLLGDSVAQTTTPSTGEPAVPAPSGFVNDAAGVLDESTRARLEAFLDQLKQKTGAEFAVLIVRTTAPLTPTEYKTRVFNAWGLGKRGEDNGLLMLVSLNEREVRFETGYGLEGVLPDGLQSRIFREVMAPRFQQGDYPGGIIAGAQQCAARIAAEKGVKLEWNGRELRYDSSRNEAPLPGWVLALVVFALVALVSRLVSRSQGRRRTGGFGGWGGGYWGGGFGGWGGGGGFGGGGGGSSFGGFGGAASGGGGGGGKW